MIFTFDQAHAYFAYRNPGEKVPHRGSFPWRCPFHGDRNASMSVNLDKGGLWNCHVCNIGGGLFDFEKNMFPGRSTDEWWAEIYKSTGASPNRAGKTIDRGPVVATYRYEAPDGTLLFEKRRHEPKTFSQRAPKDKGWVYSLEGVRKVLYHLPQVIVAKVIFIVEGEKDADALTDALGGNVKLKGEDVPAAVTCNFDGAGKWKDEYSPFLAGRRVVILPDNDEAGRLHALGVARSAVKFAESVKIVELPGLPEKGDVYDFLQQRTVEDFLKAIGEAKRFVDAAEPVAEGPFFVTPSKILPHGAPGIDWLIPGAVHRGSKGMIVGAPKAGKSMVALDLAVALTSGKPWLGMHPSRLARVGVVSREDGPGMTMTRLQQFAQGRGVNFADMPGLLVNTFQQRSAFTLEDDSHLDDLCKWIRHDQIELVIFDVLNKLHSASDENDNAKMTAIMARFDRIRTQTGADVAVIHHDSKSAAHGSKRPRGASAIDSWWDWKVSVNVSEQDDTRKEVFFNSKAAAPAPSVTVQFQAHASLGMRIVPVVSNS